MAKRFCDHLYAFLLGYLEQHKTSPSFSEMTEAMGISPRSKSLITRNLKLLEKEKRITLTKQGRHLVVQLISHRVPLLGRISAGEPIEAIVDQTCIEISDLFEGTHRFALLVRGTSMVDEGILDGDIIICRKTETAREGQVVVVLLDGQDTTLKRISYKIKGMITLVPANTTLEPKTYKPDRIQIQGIYIGLIRVN